MIHIIKGAEPQALTQEKRNEVKLYSALTTDTLDAIRKQMLEEQGYLCAYCMRRIVLGSITIEHFLAQNPTDADYEAALTVDYHNMLGVCLGNECKGNFKKNLTCDKHRGNISLTINPLQKHLVQLIKYKGDGTIYSDDPQINKDLNETLNLNYEGVSFKKNRKAVLDSLKRSMDKNFAGKKVPVERLRQWLDACYIGENGMRDPFVGIAIYYLEKKIQRG
ncbi:MAG: retron system putative HNH endonuclease [Anaerovorax sp.]